MATYLHNSLDYSAYASDVAATSLNTNSNSPADATSSNVSSNSNSTQSHRWGASNVSSILSSFSVTAPRTRSLNRLWINYTEFLLQTTRTCTKYHPLWWFQYSKRSLAKWNPIIGIHQSGQIAVAITHRIEKWFYSISVHYHTNHVDGGILDLVFTNNPCTVRSYGSLLCRGSNDTPSMWSFRRGWTSSAMILTGKTCQLK